MNRFTPVVVSLLLLGTSPAFADDHLVADAVNFDLRAIGQTQGAGVPNAIGAGAFIPLHKTPNAVTYVDIEVKGNVADRSGDSSIINTEVAGTTPSSSTRLGYRWINESGQMYGVYAGYDTRELKAGPVDTNVVVTDSRTVDFQQAAVGAEFVSNQWRFDVYALIPTGDTEQQLNSHYQGGALDTYGADIGYQINDKAKVTVGYYYQNGDLKEADGGGVSAGLNYDITNNLTAGLKVSYDDAFETRVMAMINWSFADLFKGDEAQKEANTNTVMKALNASPEQRDVRVHDIHKIHFYDGNCEGAGRGPMICAQPRWTTGERDDSTPKANLHIPGKHPENIERRGRMQLSKHDALRAHAAQRSRRSGTNAGEHL